MSVPRRIFYNTLAQSLGKVLAVILGLASLSLLSQYLQEKGFGQYSTVLAFLGFFAVLADFGLYLYVVKEISLPSGDRPPARNAKILSNALGLRFTLAGLILAAGTAAVLFLPYDKAVKQTMLVGTGAFLFVSLNQVLVGVFQKHLVQHLVVAAETAGRAVNLVLVYLFIQQTLPLPFFAGALLLSNATAFFLTLYWARRYETFGIAFNLSVWKDILKTAWPLVFSVIFNLLYFKTDTIILSWFHPGETVGVYSLSYKLLEGLIAFPAMFVGLVMPLLSQSAFVDWLKFKIIFQRAFEALLLLAVLAVTVVLFFAEPMVDLVKTIGGAVVENGAPAYGDSPALLRILILSAATIFLGTLFGYAVVAVNQQRAMLKGYLAGAVIGLGLYFAFIPVYGYWGAAWGTLVTEVFVAGFAYFLVRRASGQGVSLAILAPALPAIASLILFFKFASLPWLLEVAIGIIIYSACLVVFRAVPWQFVKNLAFRE